VCYLYALLPKLTFFTDTAKTAVPNDLKFRLEWPETHRLPFILERRRGSSHIETAHTAMRCRNHMTSRRQRLLPSCMIPTQPRPTTQATPPVISTSGRGRMEHRPIEAQQSIC